MKKHRPVCLKRRKFTVIRWSSLKKRPEEGCPVLLQLLDDVGIYMEYGSYEEGKFVYYYPSGKKLIFAEERVLGWSDLPCWPFKRPCEIPPES